MLRTRLTKLEQTVMQHMLNPREWVYVGDNAVLHKETQLKVCVIVPEHKAVGHVNFVHPRDFQTSEHAEFYRTCKRFMEKMRES